VGGDELAQCRGVEQRHVAVDHQHVAGEVGREGGDGLLHGTAGARHLVLVDDDGVRQVGGDHLGEPVALVPHHGDHARRVELPGRRQHVPDDREAAERMQELRRRGLHPRPLPGRENDDGEILVGHDAPGAVVTGRFG